MLDSHGIVAVALVTAYFNDIISLCLRSYDFEFLRDESNWQMTRNDPSLFFRLFTLLSLVPADARRYQLFFTAVSHASRSPNCTVLLLYLNLKDNASQNVPVLFS
jgi:hypothetical protein